jgi:hypothetical protein
VSAAWFPSDVRSMAGEIEFMGILGAGKGEI